MNPLGRLSLRDPMSLRDRLNPSSVLRAACLRVGAQGAVRAAVRHLAPALRRRRRLRVVVAIRRWSDKSSEPIEKRLSGTVEERPVAEATLNHGLYSGG